MVVSFPESIFTESRPGRPLLQVTRIFVIKLCMKQINQIMTFQEQPALVIIDLVMPEDWIILPEPDKALQTSLRLGIFCVQQHFLTQLKNFTWVIKWIIYHLSKFWINISYTVQIGFAIKCENVYFNIWNLNIINLDVTVTQMLLHYRCRCTRMFVCFQIMLY